MKNNKIPYVIQKIIFSLLNVIGKELKIDEISRRLLNAKYIIYNSIEDIESKDLNKVRTLDLILAGGLTQVLLEKNKEKNKYEMKIVCFIKQNNNKDAMNMAILHELIHIISTQDEIEKNIDKLIVKQGVEQIIFPLDQEGLCMGSHIEDEYKFLNEAYTQYYARILYKKIYKKEFPKNMDPYYDRAKLLEIMQEIIAQPNDFRKFIKAEIKCYSNNHVYIRNSIDVMRKVEEGNCIRSVKKGSVYKSAITDFENLCFKLVDFQKDITLAEKKQMKADIMEELKNYK